jgi:hypothetical protein
MLSGNGFIKSSYFVKIASLGGLYGQGVSLTPREEKAYVLVREVVWSFQM